MHSRNHHWAIILDPQPIQTIPFSSTRIPQAPLDPLVFITPNRSKVVDPVARLHSHQLVGAFVILRDPC